MAEKPITSIAIVGAKIIVGVVTDRHVGVFRKKASPVGAQVGLAPSAVALDKRASP